MLRFRREAVADGEYRFMWPGAAWDVVTLLWFRGVADNTWRMLRGPGPDELYHSPSGGCPHCVSRPSGTETSPTP